MDPFSRVVTNWARKDPAYGAANSPARRENGVGNFRMSQMLPGDFPEHVVKTVEPSKAGRRLAETDSGLSGDGSDDTGKMLARGGDHLIDSTW